MGSPSQVTMRKGGWQSDQPLTLTFPPGWEVTTFWPRTPPPISDHQIVEALERPIGQAPISQLCQGKRRPLIIVDDLVRPTPAARVIPWLLQQFRGAGIPDTSVTILIATGTHPAPPLEPLPKKIGAEAAACCRVRIHDHRAEGARIGRTSFRTPVIVDKEVAASDFVVGIGGVYPNATAGFGGGSKLALGVLATKSILHLHYKHGGRGWGAAGVSGNFRKDLDEIAGIIGLGTLITLHADANREPVRAVCGDPSLTYAESVAASRQYYAAPPPEDADVVISSAYPADCTLQFANMKGTEPLRHTAANASRILLASCQDGVGSHGVYPLLNPPSKACSILRVLKVRSWRQIARTALNKVRRTSQQSPKSEPKRNPIWLYQLDPTSVTLPSVPGIRLSRSWDEILQRVSHEQNQRKNLKVVIYPCAPMQFLDSATLPPAVSEMPTCIGAVE